LTGEPPIPEALHVQHDFGADLGRLDDDGKRPRRSTVRSPPIKRARLDLWRHQRVLGTSEGRHPDIAATGGRFYHDRTTVMPDPRGCVARCADDLYIAGLSARWRRYLYQGKRRAGDLARQPSGSRYLERIETLLQSDDTGNPRQMRMVDDPPRGCRHANLCWLCHRGRMRPLASGGVFLDHRVFRPVKSGTPGALRANEKY
jgi:hypothetical protein